MTDITANKKNNNERGVTHEALRRVAQAHGLAQRVCRKCGDGLDGEGYCESEICIDRRQAVA